jgi:general secretion pathway protein A
MYQEYYGLSADPFRLSPDHHFCLRHPTFAKAKAYMQFAAHRAEGFVMITGRPGTGKTTLIEDLVADLEGCSVASAKLVSSQLGADDLLHMLAYNFGINPHLRDKSWLLMELQGLFADMLASGRRPLLILDEAQGLSREALEELRMLTNLRIGSQPMLQIFLVGQEELRDLVLDPRMEQLQQRLIASCHLEPLDLQQTAAYAMHRLRLSGWSGRPGVRGDLFPILQRFSQGIPRRINLFMGRLLLHGALEGRAELCGQDAQLVYEELRHEHLMPSRPNDIFPQPADVAIDESLLRPDQSIGARLLDREQKSPQPPPVEVPGAAGPAPSRSPPPQGTWPRSLTPPPPALLREASSHPSPPAHRPLPQAPGSVPARPRAQPIRGLAIALLVAALIGLGALAIAPFPTPAVGLAVTLWHYSGIGSLRAHLYRWSGGTLPLFSAPNSGTRRGPAAGDRRGGGVRPPSPPDA